VRVSGEFVPAGKGDLDYDLYLKHLVEAGFEGPLVLHGLGEEEVQGCLSFLQARLAASGTAR
jgi:sugar phosphate isomerase/epimerase